MYHLPCNHIYEYRMFRLLLQNIRYFKAKLPAKGTPLKSKLNEKSKTISLMADKIEEMKNTLANSSPRSFGLLFILSSVPSFYFIKKLLEAEYDDPMFYTWIDRNVKYFHVKNTLFISTTALLSASKFINPASKFVLPKANPSKLVLPLLFTLVGLLLPSHIHSRWIIAPAVGAEASILPVEAMLTNEGVLPFWYFNSRYYLHFFDLLTLVVCYRAASNQQEHFRQLSLIA